MTPIPEILWLRMKAELASADVLSDAAIRLETARLAYRWRMEGGCSGRVRRSLDQIIKNSLTHKGV